MQNILKQNGVSFYVVCSLLVKFKIFKINIGFSGGSAGAGRPPKRKSQQTRIFIVNILRDTKRTSPGKCESLLPEFVLMILVECTMGRLV